MKSTLPVLVQLALLLTAGGAVAYPNAPAFPGTGTLVTLHETGVVAEQLGYDPNLNYMGDGAPPGVALGDAISLTVTYDSAEVYTPSIQIPGAAAYGFTAVPLGNGDSFNSVTLTAGSDTFTLADQLCVDPSQGATCGQQFAYGPTLLFKNGAFIGLDSCLGVTTQSTFACGLALDNLGTPYAVATDGPLRDANAAANPIVPDRADNIYFGDTSDGSISLVGHYDIVPATAVPEPLTWNLMILGFGLVGAGLRLAGRRHAVVRSTTAV